MINLPKFNETFCWVWRAVYLSCLWLVVEDCDSWHRLLIWKSSGSDICLATSAVPRHVCASCDCRPRDVNNIVSNDCLWSEKPTKPLWTILHVDSWHYLSSRYHYSWHAHRETFYYHVVISFLLWQYDVIESKTPMFQGQTIIVITKVTNNCHDPYFEKKQQLLLPGPVMSHLLNGAGCCFDSSSLLCTHDPITSICVAPYISPVPQTTEPKQALTSPNHTPHRLKHKKDVVAPNTVWWIVDTKTPSLWHFDTHCWHFNGAVKIILRCKICHRHTQASAAIVSLAVLTDAASITVSSILSVEGHQRLSKS